MGFVFGLGVFACSDDPELQPPPTPSAPDGGGAPDGSVPVSKGRALVITPPRTTVVSNLCAELSLGMTEDGAAAPFPSSGAVTITSDASTKIFATEADCAAGPSVAPTGSVDVGDTTKSFFLRTAAEGPVTLTASASFASGALTFEPQVFLGLGQPDPRTVRQRARGTFAPAAIAFHGGRMLLGEAGFRRIRVWDPAPSKADDPESSVIGDPNASSDTTSRGLSGSRRPFSATALWTDGTRLVVADEVGHRVLVWTKFPTGGEPPSFALGQPAGPDNLTATIPNNGGVSGSSMNAPHGVTSDGTRLFVSDFWNHRVLVWNTFPTSGGEPASFAIGQPAGPDNLSSHTANAGGVSGTSLFCRGDVIVGSKLVVADGGIARNGGGPVGNVTLSSLGGLRVEPTRVFIGDISNYRLTIVPR